MSTILAEIQPVEPSTSLSRKQERIIQTALELDNDPTGQSDITYMHLVHTQVGLPRKRVFDSEGRPADKFERHSGNASILLEAGHLWNGKEFVKQELPYGPMPRLITAWANTYAIRNKTREIPIANSATEFLEKLGYSVGGGKRGTYTTFRQQTQSLAASRMTFGYGKKTFDGKMVSEFEAWVSHDDVMALWPGRMLLHQDYYSLLIDDGAVPLNNAVLGALKGSSLALDVYSWLANRLRRVRSRTGDEVSWASLKQQFGHEYKDTAQGRKDFKKEFESALLDVRKLYPAARIEPHMRDGENIGKILQLSAPPVAEA